MNVTYTQESLPPNVHCVTIEQASKAGWLTGRHYTHYYEPIDICTYQKRIERITHTRNKKKTAKEEEEKKNSEHTVPKARIIEVLG